jgi:hypothetical protein
MTKPNITYAKHLVECKCVLPQFKKMENPPWHKFIVFSEIDENGACKMSYAQCTNCNAIHKVVEIGLSQILNKDTMRTLPTIDDIKNDIPSWLSSLLERHECDLPTWQEAKFVYENQLWGTPVILVKERDGDEVMGKYVLILGEALHKIENFQRFDGFIERE